MKKTENKEAAGRLGQPRRWEKPPCLQSLPGTMGRRAAELRWFFVIGIRPCCLVCRKKRRC